MSKAQQSRAIKQILATEREADDGNGGNQTSWSTFQDVAQRSKFLDPRYHSHEHGHLWLEHLFREDALGRFLDAQAVKYHIVLTEHDREWFNAP